MYVCMYVYVFLCLWKFINKRKEIVRSIYFSCVISLIFGYVLYQIREKNDIYFKVSMD